jgi:hypothetical protein
VPSSRPFGVTRIVYSADFSPDGERLVTASEAGTARIWKCGVACEPLPTLIALAPRVAGGLSTAEHAPGTCRSELIGS